jgi:hypothetical protein
MTAGKWLLCMTAVAVMVCLLAAGFSYVVDPWGLNGMVSIDGFNANKPDPMNVDRLRKAYRSVAARPVAVALGTSTAEHALNMQHRGWQKTQPAYNLAIPGATIDELMIYLRQLQAVSPVKQMVIGLDLISFNANRDVHVQSAQAADVMHGGFAAIKPYFSRDMLSAAYNTVARQKFLYPYFLPDGRYSTHFFELWRRQSQGHRKMFIISRLLAVQALFPPPAAKFGFQRVGAASTFERFQELLDFARAQNIELRLFISPCHAWQLETIRAAGLWPSFEIWKRELAGMVERYAAAQSGVARVQLWDFADYSAVTTEDVPAVNNNAGMKWFWDADHYKEALGDLVQDRIFGLQSGAGNELPAGYGVALDTKNVDAHLLKVRERQRQYEMTHATDVAQVEQIVVEKMKSMRASREP